VRTEEKKGKKNRKKKTYWFVWIWEQV
jgi:hypothetical protein